MHAIVDGRLMDAAQATVPVTDPGLLRGDGVFEVARVYGGHVFALDEHLDRMARSARGIRLDIDTTAVRRDVETLVEAQGAGDYVVRVLVTRAGRRIGLAEPLRALEPSLALATVEEVPSRLLDDLKTLSYAANMLADRLARERGADVALLVTPHGRVLEAPTASFFVAFDERRLVTPPLDDHILQSITRKHVLELVDVEERPVTRDDLRGAREAFIASTTREVQAVTAIDDLVLPLHPGPLTAAAVAAFRAHVDARVAA